MYCSGAGLLIPACCYGGGFGWLRLMTGSTKCTLGGFAYPASNLTPYIMPVLLSTRC